jgi:hypothetical protein
VQKDGEADPLVEYLGNGEFLVHLPEVDLDGGVGDIEDLRDLLAVQSLEQQGPDSFLGRGQPGPAQPTTS